MTTATATNSDLNNEIQTRATGADQPDAEQALNELEQDYLFDLKGYRILKGALSSAQLKAINAWVDAKPIDELKTGQWIGNVEVHTYGGEDGVNFQNVIEGGEVFEELIDQPAWIDQVRRYMNTSAMSVKIDECFLNVRGQGGYIGLHSGGNNSTRLTGLFNRLPTTQEWSVGQINILMALNDIGPGDGPTVVVPSSHKSLMRHPSMIQPKKLNDRPAGEALGAVEMHLKAGDALMFTDALCHGSAARTNPGRRRIMVYRYAPHLLASRYHYLPSEELLERLTPERRQIIDPIPTRMRPGRTLTYDHLPPFKG